MAGQPKRGLDFAAWDVHLFDDDERFDVLVGAQGSGRLWSIFLDLYQSLCNKWLLL